MARKASGADQLASARELLRRAKTADELRTAQAVLLPLEQTAKAIGRSVGATCNLRTRYCKVARREREAPRPKRALRNRAHATLEREAQILDEVLEGAMRGGVAYSSPNWTLNPRQTGHEFQAKLDMDSRANWTLLT